MSTAAISDHMLFEFCDAIAARGVTLDCNTDDIHAGLAAALSAAAVPVVEPQAGLYDKFRISRTDGTSAAGEKHDGCRYFVLDLTHDLSAWPALAAYANACRAERPVLASELAAQLADAGVVVEPQPENEGDEHHTLDELYEYRMLYNVHAAQGWLAAGFPVVKSWRHSDGELCFGGGWFIVVATLPAGQVSNHYAAEHWDLFQLPEAMPPEYDGHTPQVAADRLRAPVGAVVAQPDDLIAVHMDGSEQRRISPPRSPAREAE